MASLTPPAVHNDYPLRSLTPASFETVQTPYVEHFPSTSLLSPPELDVEKKAGPQACVGWLAILALVLRTIIVLFCFSIIGLVFHSKVLYSESQNINFSGIYVSWPRDLDLLPVEFVLILAVVSVAYSLLSLTQHCGQIRSMSRLTITVPLVASSVLFFGAWVAADVFLNRSIKFPSSSLRQWSCRRRDSPTNILVNYAFICREQVREFLIVLMHHLLTQCRKRLLALLSLLVYLSYSCPSCIASGGFPKSMRKE